MSTGGEHPSAGQLHQFVTCTLPADVDVSMLSRHLADCGECRDRIEHIQSVFVANRRTNYEARAHVDAALRQVRVSR